MVSPNKISSNKSDFSSVKLNSWAVPSYQVANDMLHVMSDLCIALDLHTTVPWPLEHSVGDSSWRSEGIVKKSYIVPFNAIIIIIIIIKDSLSFIFPITWFSF